MDLGAAGLREQPFPTHGKALTVVDYASQQQALRMLETTRAAADGLCLLQGPPLSGKSSVVRRFIGSLPGETAYAVVDGKGLNTTGLLEAVLRQFGYVLDHGSITELLAMLRVFAMQQAASCEPPILIVENAQGLNPSALRALCELADLRVGRSSALKMVLVSDRSLLKIIQAPAMDGIYRRLTHDFHLRPMTNSEATNYLYMKLRMAGSNVPEFVFPLAVCTELWRASGGWPGILDRLALLALAKAETLPASVELVERPVIPKGTWHETASTGENVAGLPPAPPTLYVSLDGKTLQELTFEKSRLLIGRSAHNDIPIDSKFVSRHHALLVRNGSTTFLTDLNSTNGTIVNSRRVSNHVLMHNDVIALGHHRIKFVDPGANRHATLAGDQFADTAVMKTLDDMRRLLAQENTEIMPAPTENLPTAGL